MSMLTGFNCAQVDKIENKLIHWRSKSSLFYSERMVILNTNNLYT